VVIPQSKAACLAEIDRLRGAGADAVILGCTEIGLLIQPSDLDLPVFDTTRIHAEQALGFALGPG
jgi:aspartate racemase